MRRHLGRLGLALAIMGIAAPALADPPHWRHHHRGWKKGPRVVYGYPPPPVYYAPPPVYYAPPPVVYAPPAYLAPGISFGINIPLR